MTLELLHILRHSLGIDDADWSASQRVDELVVDDDVVERTEVT